MIDLSECDFDSLNAFGGALEKCVKEAGRSLASVTESHQSLGRLDRAISRMAEVTQQEQGDG